MKYRVVIADDEAKIIRLIEELGQWGSLGIEIVDTCTTGSAALESILRLRPDFVLSDIKMPGLDGLELIQKVRDAGAAPLFILISGYRHFEYARTAVSLGVMDYLLKPVDEAQLNETLERVCRRIDHLRGQQADSEEARSVRRSREREQTMRLFSEVIFGDRRLAGRYLMSEESCNARYATRFAPGCYRALCVFSNLSEIIMHLNFPIVLAVVITVLISVGFGMIGTLFEQLLQLPRIFVSIGLSTVYQGIAYVITNAKTISSLPPAFKAIGQGTIFHPSLTYATIFMIVAGVFMSFIMDRTYFGRYVFALGGNEAASRLAGINIKRMKYAIGGIAGLFCGIGAVILTSRVGAAAASTAAGTEITVLTGVLVGGVSVRGGEGKIANCVAGVLIMGLLANGMQLAGLNTYYQYVAKGAIMLLVMWFDAFQIKRRAIASNKRKEERAAA